MNLTYNNHSNFRLLNNIDPQFLYPLSGAYIIIIAIGIVGNTFVFFMITLTKHLRSSATNVFILSLSISDLITAAITMPLEAETLLRDGQWNHGETMCNMWTTLYLIAVPTSILTLLAVSIDRYKMLSDPLNKYKRTRFMTRRRALGVVFGLWLYSILFALIPLMGWRFSSVSVHYGRCNFNITQSYSALSSIVNFIVPLLMTSLMYLKIYHIAKKNVINCKTGRKSSLGQTRDQKIWMKNLKASKTILVIVCGFFLCWFPFTVLSLIEGFCKDCARSIPRLLSLLLLLLGYTNSALNPYLYSIRNKRFRDSSIKIVKRLSAGRSSSIK